MSLIQEHGMFWEEGLITNTEMGLNLYACHWSVHMCVRAHVCRLPGVCGVQTAAEMLECEHSRTECVL